jgi:3-methyl-2-oxobutanoate hydroxymethyltransferase
MNAAPRAGDGKVTVPSILSRKTLPLHPPQELGKITCLTAYDYPTAVLLDEAGVDILLVGDSLGMVVLGYDSTLPVTLEEVLHHARSVRRGTRRALLVADLPYGSYHVSIEESVRAGLRLVKEAGAEAVKVEGGERRRQLIRQLVEAEIPVMGHIGLTPQSLNVRGGFKVEGRSAEAAEQIMRDACAVEDAGAFAVVVESVPRELGAQITEALRIPTVGIGAGPDCDGQILVFHDLVGLTAGASPKFVRQYANLAEEISRAVARYLADVRSGEFPSDAESYHLPSEIRIRSLDRS